MATYYLISTINSEALGYTIFAESESKASLHKKAEQLWLSADKMNYNCREMYSDTLYINYKVLSKTALKKIMNLEKYYDCLQDAEDYPEYV